MPNPNKRFLYARRRVGWPEKHETENEKAQRLAKEKAWSDKVDKALQMQLNGASEKEVEDYLRTT